MNNLQKLLRMKKQLASLGSESTTAQEILETMAEFEAENEIPRPPAELLERPEGTSNNRWPLS
jgi:hypothetical protein